MVGEPTGCDLVYKTKGVVWLRLYTRGRAAHNATPERGENAVYKMADVLRYLRDELPRDLAPLADPVLGPPTASVGTIHGGSKVNIVPEGCAVELDVRTVPAQDRVGAGGLDRRERLRRACPDVEIEYLRGNPPLDTAPESSRACRRCKRRAGPVGRRAMVLRRQPAWRRAASPSVAAGPGDIAQAHTADEFLTVADLRQGVKFYANFLRRV